MINELLSNKKLVFVSTIPIRWSDMDAMGHVNNVTFFRYMEQARIEWYGRLRGLMAGRETAIVHNFCHYLHALTYPGSIRIQTFAGDMGRSSFKIVQTIHKTDDLDRLIAYGGSTVVWIDPKTNRSTPIPDDIRKEMESS